MGDRGGSREIMGGMREKRAGRRMERKKRVRGEDIE